MCKLKMFKNNMGETINVADIKMQHIQNIVKQAERCKAIKAIVLFGSSLEERCSYESDIDIAIVSKYTVSELDKLKTFKRFMEAIYTFDMAQEYDRIYFSSLDEINKNKDEIPICEELATKGRVIYKRKVVG